MYKNVFASKTVWTALIGLISAIAVAAGVIPEGVDNNQVIGGFFAIVSAAAGYFRIIANKKLSV